MQPTDPPDPYAQHFNQTIKQIRGLPTSDRLASTNRELAPDKEPRNWGRSRGTPSLASLSLRTASSGRRPRTPVVVGESGLRWDAMQAAGVLAVLGGVVALVLLAMGFLVGAGVVVFCSALVAALVSA